MGDIIQESPVALAQAAGLSLDEYSLARMIASEVDPKRPIEERIACGECARNHASEKGMSISSLLLYARVPEAKGYFGRNKLGKWASTYEAPRKQDYIAARTVMEGSNITGGAVDFFDPYTQNTGKQGDTKLTRTSVKYIKDNASNRLQWVGPIDGVDAMHLMVFYRTDGPADPTDALAFLDGSSGPFDTVPGVDPEGEKALLTQAINFVTRTLGLTVLVTVLL